MQPQNPFDEEIKVDPVGPVPNTIGNQHEIDEDRALQEMDTNQRPDDGMKDIVRKVNSTAVAISQRKRNAAAKKRADALENESMMQLN